VSTFFVSGREFSEFKSEVNGFLSEFREAIPNLNKKLDSVIKLVEINKNEIDNLKVTAPVADSEGERIFLDKIHSNS
jgi:ABC-type transporter Mla subunit MlaD